MLTDAFFRRYEDVELWPAFSERERRFLNQAAQLITEEVFVRNKSSYKEESNDPATKGQEEAHKRIARELGVSWLASPQWLYKWKGPQGQDFSRWVDRTTANKTTVYLTEPFKESSSADLFVKFRVSFIEVAFQERAKQIEGLKAVHAILFKADSPNPAVALANAVRDGTLEAKEGEKVKRIEEAFNQQVAELNERFRQAQMPLSYHNGFIQVSDDALVEAQIERPFWSLVVGPQWANVDLHMKEAIDKRDRGERDAAFAALQALESAIKIISDAKGWTTGKEKGAHNYIDSLGSKANGTWIADWERDALKLLFSEVRNPFGHGPGNQPMPMLSREQTDWAIDTAMSWIKSLVRRP